MTAAGPVTRRAVGLRSERGPILAAVMLTTALVALDSTIIATAIPSIVGDLGGFSQFPWLFSIYLLTQAVTTPLYGKFADTVGRKPIMLIGVAIFLLGSVLCGAAWSMPVLIAARALQGIGAGAVQPMGMTVLGDLYTVAERARVQSYITSMWGIASVVGPTLGGLFSEYLSWRWIFYVNVPLGAVAVLVLATKFTERVARQRRRIDYAGAALLIAGLPLLLLGLLEGGVAWSWNSIPSLAVFTAGAVVLITFGFVERRAAEPMLPLWVFRHRTLVGGNLAAIVVGAMLMGLSSYLPTFVENVLGTRATVAGLTLGAMIIAWAIASGLSGQVYLRIGLRDTALIGSVLVVAGAVLISRLARDAHVWQAAAAALVVGTGLGLSAGPVLIAVQSTVGWEHRGVVTGTNMFSRSLGSTVGVAIFGAISNGVLTSRFAHPSADVAGHLPDVDSASSVLGGPAGDDSPVAAFVRGAVYDATHHVFVVMIAVAAVSIAALLLMPRRTKQITVD